MADCSEITSAIGALAVHTDSRAWNDVMELFTAEVKLDYTSLFGGDPQSLTREQLITNWRAMLPGFTRTTHLIGPPLILGATGETAQAAASVTAWHWIDDPALGVAAVWIVHGCYELTLAKRNSAWRIAALTLARGWVEGNEGLPQLAPGGHGASPPHPEEFSGGGYGAYAGRRIRFVQPNLLFRIHDTADRLTL